MNLFRKISIFILAGVLTLSIFSCNPEVIPNVGEDTSTGKPSSETISVTGITLDKTDLTLIVDKKEVITATISPKNATNKNVNWTSTNHDVATVENGTVTALAEGSATIIATTEDGGKTALCNVTVTKITVTFKDGDTILSTIKGKPGDKITAPTLTPKEGYAFVGWEPDLPETFPSENTTYCAKWTNTNFWFNDNPIEAINMGAELTEEGTYYITEPNYLYIENQDYLQITDAITLSVWYKHDERNVTAYEDIVMKGNNSYGFQYQSGTKNVRFHLTSSGWQDANSAEELSDNVWHHLVGTYDGSVQRLYVDGKLSCERPLSGKIKINDEPIYFGYCVAGDNSWLNGCIGEFRLYTRALTEDEVKKLYSGNDNHQGSENQGSVTEPTLETYNIKYELDGGTNGENPDTYNSETETITLANPSRTGYTFGGWYGDNSFNTRVTEISKGSTGNITLYAKWTANTYTIRFDANGGSGTMDDLSLTYDESCNIPQNIFFRLGYNFIGWTKEADLPKEYDNESEIINLTSENNAVITLYAKWTREGNYTISYELYGGTNSAENPDSYNVETETITLKNPSRTGYTFDGWYSDDSFNTRVTEIPKGSTGNITFWAKWTANIYTVRFDANGGTGEMSEQAFKYGESQNLYPNTFTKSGYTFSGWARSADGTKEYDDEATVENLAYANTEIITLYAKWIANIYTVRFDANGGTGEMSEQAFKYDESQRLKTNTFAKSGYTFSGWARSTDGAKEYDDEATVENLTYTNTEIITLYAKWIPKTYTITYELNEGTNNSENPDSYNVETKTIKLANPTRTGYTFAGWYSENTFNTQVTEIPKSSTGNITLWAKWVKINLSLNKTSIVIVTGQSENLIATITPNNSGENIIWSSSNSAIAQIDENGKITAISGLTDINTVTITAKYYDLEQTCSITVIPTNLTREIFRQLYPDYNSITKFEIPYGITSIGEKMFYDCSALTDITIPDSVTSIGQDTFLDCSNIALTIPYSLKDSLDTTLRESLKEIHITNATSISAKEFYGWSNLSSIVIADGVNSISNYAFQGCFGLTSVTIPDSVTSIGDRAFHECSSLTSITIPDSVTSIGASAFSSCRSLTSITIPDSVTSIGRSAFLCCSSLTSITIPDSVTSIGDWAFHECSSLTSIAIPDSVTSIGATAFSGCSGLTSITIPHSLKDSLDDTFRESLKEIHITNATSISAKEFSRWSNLSSIIIADGVTSIGDSAFYRCSGLTSVTIPDSVTSIGGYAFSDCSSLKSITIPDSVTSIGTSAFSGCKSLTSVTIPDSVTSIGATAFSGCSGLTSITIPDSVTSIGDTAFSGCSGLTSITIPDSVTSIGRSAFFYCSGLTSITIPDSVTSIGEEPFSSCKSLTSINVNIGNLSYSSESGILFNKDKTKLIQYPNGKKDTSYKIQNSITSIGTSAFFCCSSLKSITIPDSVTSIGDYAFYGCSNLTTTIPDSVTSIGNKAFYGCFGLTRITISDSVTSIGDNAFSGCASLKSVHFDDTNNWTYKNNNIYEAATITSDEQNALNLRGITGYNQDWSKGMQKN